MPRRDLREEIEQILEGTHSANIAVRRQAFMTLFHRSDDLHSLLLRTDIQRLAMQLQTEKDGDTVRCGLLALNMLSMEHLLASSGNGASSNSEFAGMRLGDWLVHPFHGESAVFSVVDTEPYRRDEPAETPIGRRLSHDEFPRTKFQHFFTSQQRAHLALPEGGYKAVWVIGRKGLFGPRFRDLIRCRSLFAHHKALSGVSLRFELEVDNRPKGLPRNAIDPAYHYILEHHGDGTSERHETVDDGIQRRDYGIVQCYTIELCGIKIFVVICAGASSLGTLGAANWASLLLFRDEGARILVAPGIKADSRMEALVRVKADSTLGAWESPSIELIKLFVDDYSWFSDERRWIPTVPKEITVLYRGGVASGVVFDRGLTKCSMRDSDMFTLIVELAQSALKGTKRTPIDQLRVALAERKGDKKGQDAKKDTTDSQLGQLRTRYLHDGLTIEGDSAVLQCKVRRFDES